MAKVKKEEAEEIESSLKDFKWDANAEDDTFFGVKSNAQGDLVEVEEVEEKEEIKEEVKEEIEEKEETKEDSTKKKKKTEKPEEEETKEEIEEKVEKVEFFKEKKEEVEKEESAATDDKFFNVLATELKEAGIYQHVEVPEDENLSQEDFIDMQDQEVNARVDETFEGFFEEMDDDGKAFLKFKKEGGNTPDFFKILRNETTIPKGEIGDDKYDKAITKYYLKEFEGLDDDDITDRIEWLEEGEKLGKYAEKYDVKVRSHIKKEKESLLKQQKDNEKSREDKDRVFHTTLKKTLDETDEIKAFPINKKEKAELFSYITKPSVKIGKNKYITAFQNDMGKVTNNYETLVLLAKLVKGDFDISDIETKIDTKKTRSIKRKMQDAKKDIKPRNTGSSGKKQLSDYFE